jgi:SWI/SNF-related matrix-associated actin-dependent regulator 1 of chromatin subfamily A
MRDKVNGWSVAEELMRIGALKQIAARGKVKAVREWVQSFLETDEKLVLFAHHKEVIEALREAFPEAAVLRGSDSTRARQDAVDRFQNNPECRLFIASLMAGGVGITLTAASHVAFIEYPWRPADLLQGEDRIHRIGQEAESVNVWHFVAERTVDEDIIELLNSKMATIQAVTDGKVSDDQDGSSIVKAIIRRFQ